MSDAEKSMPINLAEFLLHNPLEKAVGLKDVQWDNKQGALALAMHYKQHDTVSWLLSPNHLTNAEVDWAVGTFAEDACSFPRALKRASEQTLNTLLKRAGRFLPHQIRAFIIAGATDWSHAPEFYKDEILDLWARGVKRPLFKANNPQYEAWIREWEDAAKEELEGVGLYKDLVREIVSYF